ncbi:sulfurtransferase TusA family protein [Gilvimarinus sp. F26214L]|uniref:sulfurtransferase TusA family protein n=1 Tax=Gilvimarinus sp. DZF01 TaxID=3461371 RepID=UPI0040460756
MSDNLPIASTVDATGLNCPLPLLKAKQGLKQLSAGQCLKVIATDPGSVRDFQVFSELSGNKLLHSGEQGGSYCYILQKV